VGGNPTPPPPPPPPPKTPHPTPTPQKKSIVKLKENPDECCPPRGKSKRPGFEGKKKKKAEEKKKCRDLLRGSLWEGKKSKAASQPRAKAGIGWGGGKLLEKKRAVQKKGRG